MNVNITLFLSLNPHETPNLLLVCFFKNKFLLVAIRFLADFSNTYVLYWLTNEQIFQTPKFFIGWRIVQSNLLSLNSCQCYYEGGGEEMKGLIQTVITQGRHWSGLRQQSEGGWGSNGLYWSVAIHSFINSYQTRSGFKHRQGQRSTEITSLAKLSEYLYN